MPLLLREAQPLLLALAPRDRGAVALTDTVLLLLTELEGVA